MSDDKSAEIPAKLAICLEALERFPLDAQLLCAAGGYLQSQDRFDMAARAYRTALEHGQTDPFCWHVPDIGEIAAICLALVLELQDEDAEARQVLEAALERSPGSVRARRHLIDLHVKHDRRKAALDAIDRLPDDTPHREALRSAVRGACLAARQNWGPAAAYLQSAYAAGCRDPLCLRWLAVTLISTGQVEAAAPLLAEWHEQEPRNVECRNYLAALEAGTLVAESIEHGIVRPEGRTLRVDQPATSGPPRTPAHVPGLLTPINRRSVGLS